LPTETQSPPQPEAEYIIAALQEELQTANQNRLYLLSLLKQMVAEHQADRSLWEVERESLLKRIRGEETTAGE
jgi:hypothetical protein